MALMFGGRFPRGRVVILGRQARPVVAAVYIGPGFNSCTRITGLLQKDIFYLWRHDSWKAEQNGEESLRCAKSQQTSSDLNLIWIRHWTNDWNKSKLTYVVDCSFFSFRLASLVLFSFASHLMILHTCTVTLVIVVVLHGAKYFAGVTLSAQQMCRDFLSFICTSWQKYMVMV